MFGKLREATAPWPRDERNMRAARRQLELFMDDGIRERITVALALLDENVESRSEAECYDCYYARLDNLGAPIETETECMKFGDSS